MTWTPLLTTKIEIGAVVALVLVGGIALREHDANIREAAVAAAVQQTQDKLQKEYQQQVDGLTKQMAERDAAYQAQLKSLDGKFQQAQNPNQIAALVAQLIGLKQPIQIVTPPSTPENPHPAPIAEVSTLDAPQVKAYVQACESCKIENTKLVADAADRETQMALAQKQIDSLKTENHALQVAAKGGSTWHRVGSAVKYIVTIGIPIGIAIGAKL